MAHLFISYATPDRAIANEVSGWLRVDAVIGVVTSSFLASTWCSAELATARALGCRLMPLYAEAGGGAWREGARADQQRTQQEIAGAPSWRVRVR